MPETSTVTRPVVFLRSDRSIESSPSAAPGTCPRIFSCGASIVKSTFDVALSTVNFLAPALAGAALASDDAAGASCAPPEPSLLLHPAKNVAPITMAVAREVVRLIRMSPRGRLRRDLGIGFGKLERVMPLNEPPMKRDERLMEVHEDVIELHEGLMELHEGLMHRHERVMEADDTVKRAHDAVMELHDG